MLFADKVTTVKLAVLKHLKLPSLFLINRCWLPESSLSFNFLDRMTNKTLTHLFQYYLLIHPENLKKTPGF